MRIERYYYNVENKINDKFRKKFIRWVYLYIGGLLYSLIFYLFICIRYFCKKFKKKKNYKYEVTLCAIFKDEGKYLKEWIEYHRLIGVDHIYLYNNNSTDNYDDVLETYIEEGYVSLFDWSYEYAQMKAYKNCYEQFHNEAHWIGYIDIDEFVNLQKDDDIKILLSHYNAFPSLYLCWRMFGTSGFLKENNDLVIERYTSCWSNLCNTGKSFINTEFNNFKFRSPHYFASFFRICHKISIPLFGVCDNYCFSYGNDIFFEWFYRFHHSRVYINHYWSKSYEWYVYKDYHRGDASCSGMVENRKAKGRFELHELKNVSKDYSIQRFLVLLKN